MSRTALVHFNHVSNGGIVGWPSMRNTNWSPNYGDMLVCASILKRLNLLSPYYLSFGDVPSTAISKAIIRGSTYLHSSFDFASAIKTIEHINGEIVLVGLGAQNPTLDVTYLDNNNLAKRFIALISEKSKSISVRGDFSAALVSRLGCKNIRVTGCPSMFYSGATPIIKVPELLTRAVRRLGISVHSELHNDAFCRDFKLARSLHGRLIEYARNNSQFFQIFEQGNKAEFAISDRHQSLASRLDAAQKFAIKISLDNSVNLDYIISRFASIENLEEWLGKARDLDAMLGFRFHGNMVALCQGIPAYYFVYDSRIEEFCKIYSLPFQSVEQPWRDPVKAICDHDWSSANGAIARCGAEFDAFWKENDLIDSYTQSPQNK